MTKSRSDADEQIDRLLLAFGEKKPERLIAAVRAANALAELYESRGSEKDLRVLLHAWFAAIEDCYETPPDENPSVTAAVKTLADAMVKDANKFNRQLDEGIV